MLYRGMKIFLGPVVQAVFHPTVTGREHVPASGPAILAGNHVSVSDHFFVPHVLDRKVIYLAKAQYFTGQGIRGRLVARLFNALGQKPVDRQRFHDPFGLISVFTSASNLTGSNGLVM